MDQRDWDRLASFRSLEPCDGCGGEGATECRWLRAPLGLTAVHVHPGCEDAALAKRGGGRFVDPPRAK